MPKVLNILKFYNCFQIKKIFKSVYVYLKLNERNNARRGSIYPALFDKTTRLAEYKNY